MACGGRPHMTGSGGRRETLASRPRRNRAPTKAPRRDPGRLIPPPPRVRATHDHRRDRAGRRAPRRPSSTHGPIALVADRPGPIEGCGRELERSQDWTLGRTLRVADLDIGGPSGRVPSSSGGGGRSEAFRQGQQRRERTGWNWRARSSRRSWEARARSWSPAIDVDRSRIESGAGPVHHRANHGLGGHGRAGSPDTTSHSTPALPVARLPGPER